ncbi:MAG: cell wall metabolism sensor histidine kinase WalK, partial [Erysipelothrix sp.]|nr:cell wall metabolism sensor histidine kinase WalK [Erysipelothrix sp.]
ILPHVFERFYRGDASRERYSGSSGLGLAISKSIIEAHGGTIDVKSKVGKGTCFIINLDPEITY